MELEGLNLQGGDAFCGGILDAGGNNPSSATLWNFWDPENRRTCCDHEDNASFGDCDDTETPAGPAFEAVLAFSESEAIFIDGYATAWKVATTNGFSSLTAIGTGKGIEDFMADYKSNKVTQSCAYSFFDCPATLGQCLWNAWDAWWYCSSEGTNGSYRYDWDL